MAQDLRDLVRLVQFSLNTSSIKLNHNNYGNHPLTHNPEFHQRTKHIELRERFITFLVDKGIVNVFYVPTAAC